ncbi:MAG: hypothetical protein JNG89_08030 [Planctomycetaceae bacterium]|nr:hypothetical protein [Planctomycetaceae bacterium]
MTHALVRWLSKRIARCTATVALLIASYFASAPFVVVTTRLRAPASRANELVYWYYLPALAYQGSDIPGSTLYEGYYDGCARHAAQYWEPR